MGTITIRNRIAIAALAAFVASGAAWADSASIPHLTFHVGSGENAFAFAAGEVGGSWANGNGTFGFAGNTGSLMNGPGGFTLAWNLLAGSDPFLLGNIAITNTSLVTQELVIDLLLPTWSDLPASLVGGSIASAVTDLNGDGASLASIGPGGMYTAITDLGFSSQATAGSLLTASSVSAGSFLSAGLGPVSFGEAIPGQPHGAVFENIGIRLHFMLSAGDAASFTTIFMVEAVPAPGAVALLGLSWLSRGGRRRR
jgi:hypothetical protein